MNLKRIGIWGVVAAVALVVALGIRQSRTAEVETLVVEPKPTSMVLAITGRLDPIEEASVSSVLASSKVSEVRVDIGSKVSKGQVLIQLDTSELTSQLAQSRAGSEVDEESLIRAKSAAEGARASSANASESLASSIDLKTRRDEARDALRVSKQRLESAQAQLIKVRTGGRQGEVTRAQATVLSAEASLKLQTKNLARKQELFKADAISKSELESAELAYETAHQEVIAAQANLEMVKTPRAEDLEVAEASVREAKATQTANLNALSNAERAYKEKLSLKGQAISARTEAASSNLAISIAEAQLAKSRASVTQIQAQLSKTSLVSPIDGVISRRSIFVGETAQPGMELLRVTSDSKFRAVADVDEKYVRQVEPGQAVLIQPEAYPDIKLPARIDSISREANKDKGTVLVRFSLEKFDPRLRADLTVDINITTKQIPEAIVVPETAVVHEGEKASVFVVKDSKAVSVPVNTGAGVSGGYLILSGLSKGDQVIVSGKDLKDGQSVRVKAKR